MQDIILHTDNDLLFKNGDFVIADSTYQDVKILLIAVPGSLRGNGYYGMDLFNELDEDGSINFKAELKKQLKLDNKRLKNYSTKDGKLSIDVENT